MGIIDVLNTNNPDIIKRWKELCTKDIKDWSKRNNPFKVKVSNYYLYINTKSFQYSIVLSGVRPNAGLVKGYSAPVNKYYTTHPYPAYYDARWHTLRRKRQTSPIQGVKPLHTEYYGKSGMPSKYFGLKRGSTVRAYGLYPDDTAVPIYSNQGFVEYLTETNLDELYLLLEQAGFTALSDTL